MFRLIGRTIGLWLLAGAFVAAVIDGMKSIAASKPVVTSAFTAWSELAPAALGAVRGMIEAKIGPAAWSAFVGSVLALPTWALLGLLGAAFVALGRRRGEPVGLVP